MSDDWQSLYSALSDLEAQWEQRAREAVEQARRAVLDAEIEAGARQPQIQVNQPGG